MKGLIINNAYNRAESILNQSKRLQEEFLKLGVSIDIKRNDFFPTIIKDSFLESCVKDYDFCVYLDKDKYVAKMLEKAGLKLFNSSSALEICDDKMNTHIILANHGIPMPDTIPGLLCYNKEEPIREEIVDNLEKKLTYPIVIKESYGSLGKGVFIVKNRNELLKKMQEVKSIPHLFQQFIDTSYGKDVRVIVIGGKVYTAMLRQSDGDFRSNVELGGKAYVFDLPLAYRLLCEKVSKIIGLDYCGIDVLIGKMGAPVICEVNSNAFWGRIEKVTGKNVAKAYSEYIISSIKD